MPDRPDDETTGFPTSSELSHEETFPPPAPSSEPASLRKGRRGIRLVFAAIFVGLVSLILILYFLTR
jgi:hypothetical protein